MTHDDCLTPPERPGTRRLEVALARLETETARAAERMRAAGALAAAASHALAELDAALADAHG